MKIRITAKQDGFRRCGLAHSKTPTDHTAAAFTPEQLAILKAEPLLIVEEVEGGEETGPSVPLVPVDKDEQVRFIFGQLDLAGAENEKLRADLDSAGVRIADYEQQLSGVTKVNADLAASLETCRLQIADLEAQLSAATSAAAPKKGKKRSEA